MVLLQLNDFVAVRGRRPQRRGKRHWPFRSGVHRLGSVAADSKALQEPTTEFLLLAELKEADAIARIYDKFSLIGMDLPGYAHLRAKEALAEIDDRLLDRSLSKRIFRSVSTHETRPFVDDLTSGKRKG